MSINFNGGGSWIGTEGKLSTVLEDIDKFSTGADKYSTGVDKFALGGQVSNCNSSFIQC